MLNVSLSEAIRDNDFPRFKELLTDDTINLREPSYSTLSIWNRLLYENMPTEWLAYTLKRFRHVININGKDLRGGTALYAVSRIATLQLLLDEGADVYHIDNNGHSILDAIISYRSYADILDPGQNVLDRIALLADHGAPLPKSMTMTFPGVPRLQPQGKMEQCAFDAHAKRQKRIRQCRLAAAMVVYRSGNTCALAMDMRRMIAKRILLTHMNPKWLQEIK